VTERLPSSFGKRTLLYAAIGLLLGGTLTLGGYLVDYYALYNELPSSLTPGVVRGLHAVTPVHYFADLFAIILALAGGLAGWFQDRVIFYTNRLEMLVDARTSDLRRSEERYALAAEGTHGGIWDWDLLTDKVYYARRWKSMLGLRDDEIGDRPTDWFDRVHPDDVERVRERVRTYVAGQSAVLQVDYRMRHADGSHRWMLARGVRIRDAEGRPTRMAGSQTDIHDRRQQEQQLRHLALHDALTDLPNRSLLVDRFERTVNRCHQQRAKVAILHVGIDRFRKINESLGHEGGDGVLVELAASLSEIVKRFDGAPLFRVEGDEFVIMLEQPRALSVATRLAERILVACQEPLSVDSREVLLGLSIGIAIGPSNKSVDGAQILREAQTAMHRVKDRGSARFEIFDREMLETVEESLHLETELYQALQSGQLRPWYQPIFSIRSRRLAGFEALARWEHPDRGVVSPGLFIPLAEETGMIVPISRSLFESAFLQAAEWRKRYGDRQSVSIKINLSPKYLFHPDLESDLTALLKDTGVDPRLVHLEVTESSFIDRPDEATVVLQRLKQRGFQLALDDFGTGFSSLSMLHQLPFDILKIDREFIANIARKPDVRKIVATIVGLGKKLDLEVVAEGIETQAQLRRLEELRCDYGQGYLLGRPTDARTAERLIEAGEHKVRRSTTKVG
jgi:diguanylate cyclase (GGDEF)-like protein/PAS domain S-box-containing protein